MADHRISLFELLEVADLGLVDAASDGKDVVGEIDDRLRAGEGVDRDRQGIRAFDGVGEHEDRDTEFGFEQLEALHQASGGIGGKTAGDEPGDIVHDQNADLVLGQALLDRAEDEIGIRTITVGQTLLPVDLGSQNVAVKLVRLSLGELDGVGRRITVVELTVRHFKVEQQNSLRLGGHLKWLDPAAADDRIGDLHSEQTLAHAGVGKHYRQLILTPQIAEQVTSLALPAADPDPIIGGQHLKHIVSGARRLKALSLFGDRLVAAELFGRLGRIRLKLFEDVILAFLFGQFGLVKCVWVVVIHRSRRPKPMETAVI